MSLQGTPSSGSSLHTNAFQWVSTAEALALPKLAAKCELFIAMYWEELYLKHPEQVWQLSSFASIRITKGISKAFAPFRPGYTKNDNGNIVWITATYPSHHEFLEWRKQNESPARVTK